MDKRVENMGGNMCQHEGEKGKHRARMGGWGWGAIRQDATEGEQEDIPWISTRRGSTPSIPSKQNRCRHARGKTTRPTVESNAAMGRSGVKREYVKGGWATYYRRVPSQRS